MTSVFNENEALHRLGDNKDLLLKISAYFVVYSKKQVDLLRDAFISDDMPRLRHLTHKLLGSIANFGANAAYDSGVRLQQTLDADQREKIPEEYRSFVSEIEKLQAELSAYSQGVEPPQID